VKGIGRGFRERRISVGVRSRPWACGIDRETGLGSGERVDVRDGKARSTQHSLVRESVSRANSTHRRLSRESVDRSGRIYQNFVLARTGERIDVSGSGYSSPRWESSLFPYLRERC